MNRYYLCYSHVVSLTMHYCTMKHLIFDIHKRFECCSLWSWLQKEIRDKNNISVGVSQAWCAERVVIAQADITIAYTFLDHNKIQTKQQMTLKQAPRETVCLQQYCYGLFITISYFLLFIKSLYPGQGRDGSRAYPEFTGSSPCVCIPWVSSGFLSLPKKKSKKILGVR